MSLKIQNNSLDLQLLQFMFYQILYFSLKYKSFPQKYINGKGAV